MLYDPRTFTAKIRSHSSPVTSRNCVGEVMPALLINAPTGGIDPSSAASAASTDASSVTSQSMPAVCTPCRSATSSAASFALGSSRSRIATFQPAAASACAVARPMPRFEPAPVMMAVLSDTGMASSKVSVVELWASSGGHRRSRDVM